MTAHKKAAGSYPTPAAYKNSEQHHFTTADIERQFTDAAGVAGIHLTGAIVADGTLHRGHLDGHKPGTKNGAYILHLDGHPAGWALDFTTGASMTWRAYGRRARLSDADRAAIAAERQRREQERQQAHRTAADKARFIWSRSKLIHQSEEHPYLVTKRIQPHNARLSEYQGRSSLVIPIMGESGLTSLQFIKADGGKRFLPGGEIKGCFFGIGMSGVTASEPGRILIAEGFATGASLSEWFRQPVIVAFNAGNLEPVARRIKALYPNHELIICGDNDASGTGQKAARAAALAVGGKYLIPPIVGQDFNDAINAWRDMVNTEVAV
ncbi:toprim domain-containing protein [Methylosarcina fibrata]|uniref:toprim domain-containing protein n=1 Tax=Methylosarcina fibrata TaxID=105972 RepID=UPI0003786675|nr:toprim domain-containing protein [Methylosarcina fibrata]